MLAQKISGLGNLLRNKIAHDVCSYYNNDPHNQPPDLFPIYVECMAIEFGALSDLAGVQATLQVLALWTSTAVHHANPNWFRRECVYQQVERQIAFFGTLFPAVVQALPDDDDD
jgi:hypothetical protein